VATFRSLTAVCEELVRTRSRRALARHVADFLAGIAPEEVGPAVRLFLGQAGRGETGVSGGTLWRVVRRLAGDHAEHTWEGAVDFGEAAARMLAARPDRPEPQPLGIVDVEERVRALATARGAGARAEKERRLADLLDAVTPVEAKYIAKNLLRDMRTGVAEGVVIDALALLTGGDRAAVARAHMLEGDLAAVATRLRTNGSLAPATLTYFRPLRPMLAQTAEDVGSALATFPDGAGVEWKLDGARVQLHRRGGECRLYSRRLADITPSLPDVVSSIVDGLGVPAAILEGEVIPRGPDGRPLAFQELMRRFRRVNEIERLVGEVPVRLHLFDALQLGDEPLIDRPHAERWAALERGRGRLATVGRLVPASAAEGEAFYRRALADGFEGVMVKDLGAPYRPGMRGGGWLKVKRVVTVDLVIVAAEWGYGRRHGWLSNYHLAARDEQTGGLEMVGKTFKGLTDAEFRAMTDRLQAIATHTDGNVVFVEPRVVVEVLFTDLQKSPTYRAGLALRFARIARIRDDKAAADADTIQHLRVLHARQQAGGGHDEGQVDVAARKGRE